MAAALPVVVMAGMVLAITQGFWPNGLALTLAIVGLAGLFTLMSVDRLLTRTHR